MKTSLLLDKLATDIPVYTGMYWYVPGMPSRNLRIAFSISSAALRWALLENIPRPPSKDWGPDPHPGQNQPRVQPFLTVQAVWPHRGAYHESLFRTDFINY